MSKHACQLVLNQIARLWRAGLSGFLLLNLALLHAAATPVVAGTTAPAFSNEIQSAGHSLQRDLQRASLPAGSETASGSDNDPPSDTPLFYAATARLSNANTAITVPLGYCTAGGIAYFLPEPRAAPQL